MKKGGFSLIEIVIALFVTAAIFSAVVPLVFNTISANKAAKLKLNAYEAAQKEIEGIKNADITTLDTKSFTPYDMPNGATGTLTVTKNDPELAEINSRVSWTFKGKNENVELVTYIYGAIE